MPLINIHQLPAKMLWNCAMQSVLLIWNIIFLQILLRISWSSPDSLSWSCLVNWNCEQQFVISCCSLSSVSCFHHHFVSLIYHQSNILPPHTILHHGEMQESYEDHGSQCWWWVKNYNMRLPSKKVPVKTIILFQRWRGERWSITSGSMRDTNMEPTQHQEICPTMRGSRWTGRGDWWRSRRNCQHRHQTKMTARRKMHLQMLVMTNAENVSRKYFLHIICIFVTKITFTKKDDFQLSLQKFR